MAWSNPEQESPKMRSRNRVVQLVSVGLLLLLFAMWIFLEMFVR